MKRKNTQEQRVCTHRLSVSSFSGAVFPRKSSLLEEVINQKKASVYTDILAPSEEDERVEGI